jgi:hypothetical protein
MRRATIKEFDKLGETLSNYTSVFAFRLRNLCVKAEEVSLLPIEVLIEGELQKLEQCTTIGKDDEYSFMIFPHYDEDMVPLGHSITVAHPEFKQKIETMTVDTVDENGNSKEADVRYIRVTMPEVDDDRYDVLKDGVKVCYEECKAQMDAANAKADAQFAMMIVGESEEDIKKLETEREKLNRQWNDHRDNIYNEKLQEIEDAHNKWLAEKAERDQKAAEEAAARGEDVISKMKLTQDNEDLTI